MFAAAPSRLLRDVSGGIILYCTQASQGRAAPNGRPDFCGGFKVQKPGSLATTPSPTRQMPIGCRGLVA